MCNTNGLGVEASDDLSICLWKVRQGGPISFRRFAYYLDTLPGECLTFSSSGPTLFIFLPQVTSMSEVLNTTFRQM